MKIEVVSSERIRPASPTPAHLKIYKVCLLDQLLPSAHVPIQFFYLNHSRREDEDTHHIISQKSLDLKKSLSETLTRFYPLAGKIKDHELCINCNDDGVSYIETRVHCDLPEFLKDPDFEFTQRLLPNGPNYVDSDSGFDVIIVQVNFFSCGGVGLSMSASHQILDGTSLAGFFKDWAITARGTLKSDSSPPSFVASSLFPQSSSLPKGSTLCMWPSMFEDGKCVTKRFVFSSKSLAELKAKVATSGLVQSPTRVQSVFALIWRCAMAAALREKHDSKPAPSVLSLAADIRRRSDPPMPRFTIGNLIWSAVAECNPKTGTDVATLVGHLRNGLSKIDADFCKGLRGPEGYLKVDQSLKELRKLYSNEGTYYFSCTSLCSSGMYETAFGWGKPVWVCLGLENDPLNVYLMDTRSGDGFEAWVSLPADDMSEFERDPEILAFSSLNPSPLELTYPTFQLRH